MYELDGGLVVFTNERETFSAPEVLELPFPFAYNMDVFENPLPTNECTHCTQYNTIFTL